MSRSLIRRALVGAAATVTVAGLTIGGLSAGTAAAAQPAAAAPSAAAVASASTASISADHEAAYNKTWYFTGVLKGTNEVPVKGGPKVDDKDGSATARMRIQGDQVYYYLSWKGIGTPIAGHIHEGVAGTNGDGKIPFFSKKLPAGRNYTSGTVKVTDKALLKRIQDHPERFYFNLHTEKFPGGAVRGQLHAGH
jgi:hypothetical protein